LFEQQAALREAAEGLGMQELRAVARTRLGARIVRSAQLTEEKDFILSIGEMEESEGEWMLPVGDEGEEVTFNDADLASLARVGLLLRSGELITWGGILRTAVPVDRAMASALGLIVNSFDPAALEEAVELEVDAIDAIVGPALGLSGEDIIYIQTEMAKDPFLSKVVPRYPFFQPKQRGRRLSLERGNRYSTA
jgi:hypothetical protein